MTEKNISECVCGHSRGRHITAIQGQPLGNCCAWGCKCKEFAEPASKSPDRPPIPSGPDPGEPLGG